MRCFRLTEARSRGQGQRLKRDRRRRAQVLTSVPHLVGVRVDTAGNMEEVTAIGSSKFDDHEKLIPPHADARCIRSRIVHHNPDLRAQFGQNKIELQWRRAVREVDHSRARAVQVHRV